MGAFLLHNPWVQLYLLYAGALVVINFIHATAGQPKPAGRTCSAGVETKTADKSGHGLKAGEIVPELAARGRVAGATSIPAATRGR
jgi:hypothetical protein